MIRFSINLPTNYRLDLHLVRKRGESIDIPLFPNLKAIKKTRSGNKISRFFSHIFGHKKIKKVFGVNIALFVFASSLLPNQTLGVENVNNLTLSTPIILTTQKGVQYPLKNIKITQGYKFFHPGIDFDGITSDPIYPITSGIVETTEYSKFGYGNNVLINHGSGVTSLYAHLSKIEVTEGQEVNNTTEIGKVGATGRAKGDHLHLEIHENGKPINPLTILAN